MHLGCESSSISQVWSQQCRLVSKVICKVGSWRCHARPNMPRSAITRTTVIWLGQRLSQPREMDQQQSASIIYFLARERAPTGGWRLYPSAPMLPTSIPPSSSSSQHVHHPPHFTTDPASNGTPTSTKTLPSERNGGPPTSLPSAPSTSTSAPPPVSSLLSAFPDHPHPTPSSSATPLNAGSRAHHDEGGLVREALGRKRKWAAMGYAPDEMESMERTAAS